MGLQAWSEQHVSGLTRDPEILTGFFSIQPRAKPIVRTNYKKDLVDYDFLCLCPGFLRLSRRGRFGTSLY